MKPIAVKVFLGSTWLDLQRERAAVEQVLARFRETKFIGMEYFGSQSGTTRAASLQEVARCDLYVGIVGGRYGSGITEAEYRMARERDLPCHIYFKRESAIREAARDATQAARRKLKRLRADMADANAGHLVTEFSGAHELAGRVASDLHNWLFDKYLAQAVAGTGAKAATPGQRKGLAQGLRQLSRINHELTAEVAAERARLFEQRQLALDALAELTYEVPGLLAAHPETRATRTALVRRSLAHLDRLLRLSDGAHEVLRERAVCHRQLAALALEDDQAAAACKAYQASARDCDRLVALRPDIALYWRDAAVSHYNAGLMQADRLDHAAAARRAFRKAAAHAERAAALDAQWRGLLDDARARAAEPSTEPGVATTDRY